MRDMSRIVAIAALVCAGCYAIQTEPSCDVAAQIHAVLKVTRVMSAHQCRFVSGYGNVGISCDDIATDEGLYFNYVPLMVDAPLFDPPVVTCNTMTVGDCI